MAVDHYLADYTARGGRAPAYVRTTFEAHILPELGLRPIAELTAADIRNWHRGLATAPARLRSGRDLTKRKFRQIAAHDTEGHRARRATANAILTLFRAALNLAFREEKISTDEAWRRVKPFPKVNAARVRYLSDAEAVRLVNACASDLRPIVVAALLTGCRYQEIARLQAKDIDLAAGMLVVRASKGGQPRHVVLTAEAQQFFENTITRRQSDDLLFLQHQGSAWGKSHQFRPLREACAAAKISPPISFHILRHTHASRLAAKGVPMAVIAAQRGHSDIKLTQRHYAHLSPVTSGRRSGRHSAVWG